MDDDILKLDLYEIIGAPITADESEIKKAYRKKALSCHPDKNPDNPQAADLFRQLTKCLEILTDKTARAAYDRVLKAKAATKLRVKELDARRKKFKDDLEAREEAFRRSKTDEDQLKAELERLRKEGSRLVEEERERLRQKVLEDLKNASSTKYYGQDACKVKIKWKAAADDETNGGYNYENLHRFLSKHGEISALVLSTAKKGKALVEFTSLEAAESAVQYEIGLANNPLKLEGMWQKGKVSQQTQPNYNNFNMSTGSSLFPSTERYMNAKKNDVPQGLSCSSVPDIFNTQCQTHSDAGDADFESIVLNNMKRAEERKRLIEQMKAEDEGT